jgi:predicted O-methyltransferase YrrM
MLAGVQPFTAHIADAVDQYCQAHSNPLSAEFAEHKKWTADNFDFPERMSSSLQAQLFIFMASDRRAHRVLDVGSFSGYSALAWREGMKRVDGEVWTLENDPLMIDACKEAFKRYDPTGRIHLEIGQAIDT